MFCPFVKQWTVKGIIVGGKVPLFEDFSVPFDFSAPWLFKYDGAKVKAYFDPADPRCSAKLVLAEPFNHQPADTVLGPGSATLVSTHSGYVRLVMGWGDDPESLGRKNRQQAAASMRREVRAVMPRGQTGAAVSEERDGIASTVKIEQNLPATGAPRPEETATPEPEINRAERKAELQKRVRATEEMLTANPLDFV
jgi:hypothetical protein